MPPAAVPWVEQSRGFGVRKMRLRSFVLAFALANLSYGGLQHAMTAQSEPRPSILSGEDVMRILPGNTLLSYDESGPFWLYYPGPSTVWGQSSTGDVDVGHWWIEDGRYCRTWRHWHDGATQCWIVASYGDDRIIWMDGPKAVGESLVQPGNTIGTAGPPLLASLATDIVVEPVTATRTIGPDQPTEIADRGGANSDAQPHSGAVSNDGPLGGSSSDDSSGTGSSNGLGGGAGSDSAGSPGDGKDGKADKGSSGGNGGKGGKKGDRGDKGGSGGKGGQKN